MRRKGLSVAAQTAIFVTIIFLAAYTMAGASDIVENNVVEKRLFHYKAEELATSIGVVTQYDYDVEMEKRFQRKYEFSFSGSPPNENMTMRTVTGEPMEVEVEIDTLRNLPDTSFEAKIICVSKTYSGWPVGVSMSIDSGAC